MQGDDASSSGPDLAQRLDDLRHLDEERWARAVAHARECEHPACCAICAAGPVPLGVVIDQILGALGLDWGGRG
jgi:hypothetical protein